MRSLDEAAAQGQWTAVNAIYTQPFQTGHSAYNIDDGIFSTDFMKVHLQPSGMP